MGALDDALKLLGGDQPKGAALVQKLGVAGAKAARTAAGEDLREPDFALVDLDTGMAVNRPNSGAQMMVPSAYANAVELNLVPFVSNVGSYLQSKGIVPDNDLLAWGIDSVVDLGNLVPFGTLAKATRVGRASKVVSTLLAGGTKGRTGKELVEAAAHTLEAAAKIAAVSDDYLAAAKAGDSGKIKSILDGALSRAAPDDELMPMVTSLRKHSKELGNILENSERWMNAPIDVATGGLPAKLFQQTTRAERLAEGQINPLAGLVLPANPLRAPGTFLRQVLGITYEGDRMLMPGSALLARGLDKLLPLKGTTPLAKGLATREAEAAASQLIEDLGGEAATKAFYTRMVSSRLRLLSAIPSEAQFTALAGEAMPDKKVTEFVRGMYGKGHEVTAEERDIVRKLAVDYTNGNREEATRFLAQRRDEAFARLVSERESSYLNATAATRALMDADLADLRQTWDTFNTKWLEQDPQGVGNALASRASYGNIYASNYAGLFRETIRASYPKTRDAYALYEGLDPIIAHSDLFELDAGRLRLLPGTTEQEILEESPKLHRVLYKDARGKGLLTSLQGEGLSAPVSLLIADARSMLDDTGKVLVDEGVLFGMLSNYFPRVFNPSRKFFDTFKVTPKTAGRFFDVALAERAAGRDALAEAVLGKEGEEWGAFTNEAVKKARAGTLSMQEARRFSEGMAERMVAQGMGTYEQDGLVVLSNYLSAANQALLQNHLFRDLPNSPVARLVRQERIAQHFPDKAANYPNGTPDVLTREAWKALGHEQQALYKGITGSNRYRWDRDQRDLLGGLMEAVIARTPAAVKAELASLEAAWTKGALTAVEAGERAVNKAVREAGRAEGAAQRASGKALRKIERDMARDSREAARALSKAHKEINRELAEAAQLIKATGPLVEASDAMGPRARKAALRQAERLRDGAAKLRVRAEIKRQRAEALLGRAEARLIAQNERLSRAAGAEAEALGKSRSALQKVRDRAAKEEATWADLVTEARRAEGSAATLARAKVDERLDALASKVLSDLGEAGEPTRPMVYVFAPDAGPLEEAFHLYQEGDYSKALVAYDQWNATLKAIVLAGDLFHFNTLAVMSVVGNPGSLFEALYKDFGEIPEIVKQGAYGKLLGNAAGKAAAGAVAGAAVAPALGAEDSGDYLGFSLAGALYGAAIGAALRNGRLARKYAFNPANMDALYWAGMGGWTGRPDDRSLGMAQRGLRALRDDLLSSNNGGKGFFRDAFVAAVKGTGTEKLVANAAEAGVHLLDGYEDTLWGTLHNGGKLFYFEQQFFPALKKLQKTPDWTKADSQQRFYLQKQLATEVMQTAHDAFGAQRYAALFANPHWQYIARRFLISPDWSLSRLRFTAAVLGNSGPIKGAILGAGLGTAMELIDHGFDSEKIKNGPAYGALFGAAAGAWNRRVIARMGVPGDTYTRLARRYSGAALLGGYAIYNLINRAFTGKWMWENAEGRQAEVQLPNGMTYNPGKPFVEAFEWAAVFNTETYHTPITTRLNTKLSPALATPFRIVSGRDYFGGPFIEPEDGPIQAAYKYGEVLVEATFPIGLRNLGMAGAQALGGQAVSGQDALRAAAGIAGLPVRGRIGAIPGQPDAASMQAALRATLGRTLTPPAVGDPLQGRP